MAGRIEGDDSPVVPGTAFTEAGVVRLIAHLRKRQVRRFPFLRRLHRYLTLPVAIGLRTSAGIAVERLQIASRQIKDIERQGWDRYSAIRDARRFGAPPPAPEPKAATQRSAKSTRKAKDTLAKDTLAKAKAPAGAKAGGTTKGRATKTKPKSSARKAG